MAAKNKETIYVDVDDEITSIIEKVKASEAKIVALVLPKRATVLQSVVNMKLLKKAGTSAKKNVVLITSEKGLMPLAGVAGLHVAKSLQSKPVIPSLPSHPGEDDDEPETVDESEPALDKSATIGALAAAAAVAGDDDTETIEIDNMKLDDTPAAVATKSKKLRHLKVPNFDRFRVGIFLAVGGFILLIIGWYVAAVILPKAHVTISTNTTTAVASFDFLASTTVPELDINDRKVPAVQKESKKAETEKVKATGQKDMGTKADGEVTVTASCTTSAITVPAGTSVSSGGKNFLTQSTIKVDNPAGGSPGNWICNKSVDVLAAQNGDSYNLPANQTFTVSGFSGATGKNSSAFTGGTSKLVTVVSQKDIDDAVAAMTARMESAVGDELKAQFDAQQLMALTETRKVGELKTTATPALDAEAAETTVTLETTYTMLGIKRDDLSQLIKKDVDGDPSLDGQEVTDDGIDEGVMKINNQPSAGEAFLSFRTSVTAGPTIDEQAIKEAIKGKKRGEAETYIKDQPGVEEALIDYSPFWVYKTPSNVNKITVTVQDANGQASDE